MSSAGTFHPGCPIRATVHKPATPAFLQPVLRRWCAEGGKLICCDYCNNAFCKKCILRNLGRKELSVITNENSKWHCYVCRSEPLQDLVSKCHSVMQRKLENEDRESKKLKSKPVREHKAVINGKEEAEGSGTMTFSYKRLHVPKELMKKVKKLVETTTGLNNTFIQFIQQATAKQGDKSIRYRHLKAFKAVLADLKKAHCSLEEALVCEFRNVEVQNGKEGQDVIAEMTDGVEPVKNDSMEVDGGPAEGTDGAEEMDGEQYEEPSEELNQEKEKQQDEEAEQGSSDEKVADGTDTKDCQSEAEAMATPVKTETCDDELLPAAETSLDHDIMSVPPSVPEELFQMVESLADSTMLLQNEASSPSDSEKNAENVESDSLESQHPQPKVKNLIVKLTPVPVVTTCGSRSPRSKNREKDENTKIRGKKEESEEKAGGTPPPSRRSSRVKTTPLRKQAENTDKEESSEVDEDVKSKAKSSKRSSNAQTEDGVQVKTADSDSDEVPQALLEKAAAGHSTDEERESARSKKRLFKSNNTSTEDADKASKRKRRSESSGSDLEQKGKTVSKKKKQKDSEPSDSDLEKSKSKGSTAKKRSERAKKKDASKEESKNSPERRASDRKRSYEKKHKRKGSKAASKLQTSSSEDEEQLQDEGDSGEDSDVQKIKPIVEDAQVGADGAFHQSSGNFRHDGARGLHV